MLALALAFVGITAGIGTVAAASQRAARQSAATPTATPSLYDSPLPRAAARTLAVARQAPAAPAAPAHSRAAGPAGPPLAFDRADETVSPTLPLHWPFSAIVVDLDTHRVLWHAHENTPHATASLAKIFTVMVALDHARPDRVVTVPPGGEDDNPDDSVMGLLVGDHITVGELIDGIWLASGDDAAETLARTLIPRGQFIEEMNEKAAYLGLEETQFRNPSGVDQLGEYSSAYDLAVASGWLWLHYPQAFVLAHQSQVPLTIGGRDLSLTSLNKMVGTFPGKTGPYPGANGLKTGYTANAGGCVIATAQRGGHRLIAVVMDDDWFFTDAGMLLDYGFSVDQ